VRALRLPDRFIDQDKPAVMYRDAGLDSGAIAGAALEALGFKEAEVAAVRAAMAKSAAA